MEIVIITLIIVAFISAVLSSIIADKKGYSSAAWFFCGLFLNIFGLIAAAGLPMNPDLLQRGTSLLKTCPRCCEIINISAQVCKFCRRKFSKNEIISELGNAMKKGKNSRIIAIKNLANFDGDKILPFLEQALQYQDAQTIGLASDVLLKVDTVPALITAMKSNDFQERAKAYKRLKERVDKTSTPELINVLDEDFSEKPKIIELLGNLDDDSVIPKLIDIAENRELPESTASVSALSNFKESVVVNTLIKLLNSEEKKVRQEAKKSLIKVGDFALKFLEEKKDLGEKSFNKQIEKIIKVIKPKEQIEP